MSARMPIRMACLLVAGWPLPFALPHPTFAAAPTPRPGGGRRSLAAARRADEQEVVGGSTLPPAGRSASFPVPPPVVLEECPQPLEIGVGLDLGQPPPVPLAALADDALAR